MKIFRLLSRAFIFVCVFLSPMAHAQDQWRYQLSPYLWFAGLKGDVATIPGAPPASIEISPSEALQDLKVGLMGAFDAKKGRHGGFADLVYTDVRSDTELVPAIGLTLKSISKTTLFSAGYMYELYKNESAVVDLLAGARYWGIDTELEFGGGLGILAGRSVSHNESWVDPLIGIKGRTSLGASKFYVAGILAGGGFGVGSDHFYDVSAHVGYQWTKAVGTSLGYRVFDVKYEDGSFLYDVRQEGWLLGLTFAF
jgi:hypothetical protein